MCVCKCVCVCVCVCACVHVCVLFLCMCVYAVRVCVCVYAVCVCVFVTPLPPLFFSLFFPSIVFVIFPYPFESFRTSKFFIVSKPVAIMALSESLLASVFLYHCFSAIVPTLLSTALPLEFKLCVTWMNE